MQVRKHDIGDLCALIDEAPAEPARWDELVKELGRRAPAAKIVLQAVDRASLVALPTVCFGWTEAEIRAYAEYYNSTNLFLSPLLKGSILSVRHGEDLVDDATLTASEFYHDFLAPSGDMCRGTGLKIFADNDRFALLTVNYDRGAQASYDAWFASVLQAIGPRIQSALHASRFTQSSASLMANKNLIDSIDGPALSVDPSLNLVTANEPGYRWLDEMGLGERGLPALPEAGALASAVAATLRGINGSSNEDVLIRSSARPWRVSVIRLTDRGRASARMKPLLSSAKSCLLVIREFDSDLSVTLARQFALTKAEARLAGHLARGDSLAETADAMGISRETARTHLKAVFSKTDTKRQAELVLLIAQRLP